MVTARSSVSQDSGHMETVLYVEDNAINSKVVQYGLRGHYDVAIAVDAREACAELRKHKGAFAAILMDVELQGSDLDGIELTRLFRGQLESSGLPDYVEGLMTVDIPIIIVTAYLERYSEEFLQRAGASAYLNKPVNLSGLRALLASIRH